MHDDLPRYLKRDAERLGLHDVCFDWTQSPPVLIGSLRYVTIAQSFSYSRRNWQGAHRRAISQLRRKIGATLAAFERSLSKGNGHG